jgi:hypothetical protein
MFFKDKTIYKVFATRKGAESYISRWSVQANIEVIDNRFFVVG